GDPPPPLPVHATLPAPPSPLACLPAMSRVLRSYAIHLLLSSGHSEVVQFPTPSALAAPDAQRLLETSAAAAGVKKGVMMKSLRAALLGSLQGPDLLTSWQLLHGMGEDQRRLAAALLD
ncbi:MAG: hypothetical protein ACKOOC_06045, partial [Cyanobium sp.]